MNHCIQAFKNQKHFYMPSSHGENSRIMHGQHDGMMILFSIQIGHVIQYFFPLIHVGYKKGLDVTFKQLESTF